MTNSTFYGPRLAAPPVRHPMPADPVAALTHAAWLDRLADLHMNEGRGPHADRLAHLALELRCQALGGRA